MIRLVPYNRNLHHRRSIRLPGFDYAEAGSYYITICTAGRECMFGEVLDGEMQVSDAGRVVEEEWRRSAEIRRDVTVDAFVIMPNHLHGIVTISHETSVVGAHGHAPLHPSLHRSPRSTPAGRVATAQHAGPYGEMGRTNEAIVSFCGEAGPRLAGVSWEVYGDWEEDETKLLTDVFYLVGVE